MRSKTFYSFKGVKSFETFLRTKTYKSGELDYVKVGGHIYTMHEYDCDGRYMSWGNKKHDKLIECVTSDRYNNGFGDAKLYLYHKYGFLRTDINYME